MNALNSLLKISALSIAFTILFVACSAEQQDGKSKDDNELVDGEDESEGGKRPGKDGDEDEDDGYPAPESVQLQSAAEALENGAPDQSEGLLTKMQLKCKLSDPEYIPAGRNKGIPALRFKLGNTLVKPRTVIVPDTRYLSGNNRGRFQVISDGNKDGSGITRLLYKYQMIDHFDDILKKSPISNLFGTDGPPDHQDTLIIFHEKDKRMIYLGHVEKENLIDLAWIRCGKKP